MSNSSSSSMPGPRVAGHVAHRVAAALARGQAGVAELADQLGRVGQRDVVHLDVLPRGDVALAQRHVLLDHVGERVELVGRDAAHRQLDADHLHVGLALAVDALLEAELDEVVLLQLALRGSASTRCRSRRTRAPGSGSRGRGRSRAPRGSRASRSGGLSWLPAMRAPSGSFRVGIGARIGLPESTKRQSEFSLFQADLREVSGRGRAQSDASQLGRLASTGFNRGKTSRRTSLRPGIWHAASGVCPLARFPSSARRQTPARCAAAVLPGQGRRRLPQDSLLQRRLLPRVAPGRGRGGTARCRA